MGMSAMQAAKRACKASGWKLTNLQLQKILYIAHMIRAGRKDEGRLIENENFEAWDYGPVLPSVYRKARSFGAGAIKNVFHGISDVSDSSEARLIDTAVERLSDLEPFKLVSIVHDEHSAWAKHYSRSMRSVIIPHEDVVQEYRDRFGDECFE